jgi:hypothetical protein
VHRAAASASSWAIRPDLGVYDRINWPFLRWVWSFRRRRRPVILDRLEAFPGEVLVLRDRRDVARYLGSLASGCPDEGLASRAPARQAMRTS